MNKEAVYVLPLLDIYPKADKFLRKHLYKVFVGDIFPENKTLVRVLIKDDGSQDVDNFCNECYKSPDFLRMCVTWYGENKLVRVLMFNIPSDHERDLSYLIDGKGNQITDYAKKKIINFWSVCTDRMYDNLFGYGSDKCNSKYEVRSLEIYANDPNKDNKEVPMRP